MTDDKIITLRPPKKPERALCTGPVPSECPDAPHVRGDNLRSLIDDNASDVLNALGFGMGRRQEIADALEALDRAEAAIRTARHALTMDDDGDAA